MRECAPWLLVRRGCAWRSAIASVLIDRGVGVGLLIAFGFVVLLLPSSFTALGGYRDLVLMLYGALLLVGGVGLLLVPVVGPLFERWRASRWAVVPPKKAIAFFGLLWPRPRSWLPSRCGGVALVFGCALGPFDGPGRQLLYRHSAP